MRSTWVLVSSCLVACGGGGGGGGGDDVAIPDAMLSDATLPTATCTAPPLADVTTPTATVGDGTPESCTAAALETAAAGGGTIVFNCGTAPTTITVTAPIMFTKETVLDGGGLVALSGGGTSRILYLDSNYNSATPRLTVQRLSFSGGKSAAIGEDTAQGGAAIYADGGSLTVIDSIFQDNHGPTSGQDVAGGAIYGFGGGETVIVGSTFNANSCSDGGAVGSLNRDLTIINSTFTGNAATGTVGNPGDGGAGGAIYMDGGDEAASLCGVTVKDSTAGAIGGGVFRVSNSDDGSFAMDRSTIDNNRVTATGEGNAGGLYLQGLALTVTASTISNNRAHYNGGIWINECQVDMTNTTITENTATGSNGGGVWIGSSVTGTIKNTTIASNHSTAAGQVAGGIFGTGLTLVNTIVANNTAMYNPTCDDERSDGTGNLQWPDGSLCTASPLIADPLLGALGDNGGDTLTMLPGAGSPAKGIATGCPPTDQRGNTRGEPCTAGAVEAP
jgi:parallel beta-helix repeat protein